MKTTFQIKRARRNPWSGNLPKASAVLLLFLAFVFVFGILDSGRSLLSDFLSFFLRSGDDLREDLSGISKNFWPKERLIEENGYLEEKIGDLNLKLIDYESIKHENQRLREALGQRPDGTTAAGIIARPPQVPVDSLFINKGGSDGIRKGDFVLAGERVLIGKIAELSERKSTVALNSLAGAASYGYVERTSEPIETKGGGGGCIEARVPIDFDIEVGDRIMADGSSARLAAVVGMIEEDRSSGFKDIFMSLPVDVSKMGTVFIESRENE